MRGFLTFKLMGTLMKQCIAGLYCIVDDFCKAVDNHILTSSKSRAIRAPSLSISAIVTIELLYQRSPCKNYHSYLQLYRREFSTLPSYNRFIELKRRSFIHLELLLKWFCFKCSDRTGIAYIDSTVTSVCNNVRRYRNKVFRGIASSTKNAKGWLYGIKLHLVVNQRF